MLQCGEKVQYVRNNHFALTAIDIVRVHLWTRRVPLDVGVQGEIPLAGPKHDN